MLIDGVWIQAEDLVNGATIERPPVLDDIFYYHVELDSHDALLAEGAASESFVDDGSRGMFHNAHEFSELYPEAAGPSALYGAPRVQDGYVLDAARPRIDARAGLAVAEAPDLGDLTGALEGSGDGFAWGFARNDGHPGAPVCLDIWINGVFAGLAYADEPRADGTLGFRAPIPPHAATLELRRSADGKPLDAPPNAPRLATDPCRALERPA